MLPFTEKKIDNSYIREFSLETSEEEFVWHRDQEDRIIKSLNDSYWALQLDNELPKILEKDVEFFIPKGIYHRVLKGKKDLILEIQKL